MMADSKISSLPSLSTVTDEDLLPVVDNEGTTGEKLHKVRAADLATYFNGKYALNNPPPEFTLTGAWSSGTTYAKYTAVTYNGGSYVSKADANLNKQPDTETTWWFKLADKGATGSTGSTGATGATGAQPWATPPAAWASTTAYTATAPASVVTYGGETYVCSTSHTSTGSFDSGKFTKIAQKGADGSGSGDFSGPASSTDGAPVVFNGTTGKLGKQGTTTGSGNIVLATSPTLTTPALGTPSAVVLTNGTGLPISTGVSGLATGVATFLATPTSANLAAALTDETGSGANVFATSPTLVTPILGTPTSGTLTNCTGLPVSTGVSGLGTGVATFLATPSSANLAAAVTDETGSGALVFATSPTLTTPNLGTPSALTLTNATGLVYAGVASGAIATSAEYYQGTASKLLNAANVWTARQAGGNTSTNTLTPDLSAGVNIDYTATGNFTLGVPTNAKVGMCGSIRFTQDGTGSRTITYNSIWKVAGGSAAALSTAASAIDVLYYEVIAASAGTPSLIYYSLQKAYA